MDKKIKIDIIKYLDLIKDGSIPLSNEIYELQNSIPSIVPIPNGSTIIREKTFDSNIDYENLIIKNKKKTTQTERLLILFLLENGILSHKMLRKHNINSSNIDKLKMKGWDISSPITGIYVLENLHTSQIRFAKDIDLWDAIFGFENFVWYNADFVDGSFKHYIYISSKYRGKITNNTKRIISYCKPEILLLNAVPIYINSDLYYYTYDDFRRFCELIINIRNDIPKYNITAFKESTYYKSIKSYLTDFNIIGESIDKEKCFENINILSTLASKMGISQDMILVLNFFDKSVNYEEPLNKNNTNLKLLDYFELELYKDNKK